MGHKWNLLRKVLIRLLIASPLFLMQIYCLMKFGAPGVIVGIPFGLGGALILAYPLIELLAEPLRSLFYPLKRFDKPVPMYGVPISRRANGDFDGALAEYERMEQIYPGDIEIYRGMIEILVLDIRDKERASVVFQRALKELSSPGEKAGLARVYEGMLSQAAGKPDWYRQQQERNLKTRVQDGPPVAEPDGVSRRRFHSGGHRTR